MIRKIKRKYSLGFLAMFAVFIVTNVQAVNKVGCYQLDGGPPHMPLALFHYFDPGRSYFALTRYVYTSRIPILKALTQVGCGLPVPSVKKSPQKAPSQLLIMMISRGYISEIRTQYFEKTVIPQLNNAISKYGAEYGIEHIGQFVRNYRNMKIALRLLVAGL